MRKLLPERPDRSSKEWQLAEHLIKFINAVFGRKMRGALGLYKDIREALEGGYSEDDIRLAFWAARCLPGDIWIKKALMTNPEISPSLVLRFKGGLNSQTGQPAKRWLDDLSSIAPEMNPALVGNVLRKLPGEMLTHEVELLKRNGISFQA